MSAGFYERGRSIAARCFASTVELGRPLIRIAARDQDPEGGRCDRRIVRGMRAAASKRSGLLRRLS